VLCFSGVRREGRETVPSCYAEVTMTANGCGMGIPEGYA